MPAQAARPIGQALDRMHEHEVAETGHETLENIARALVDGTILYSSEVVDAAQGCLRARRWTR